jgi:hypothetical protein
MGFASRAESNVRREDTKEGGNDGDALRVLATAFESGLALAPAHFTPTPYWRPDTRLKSALSWTRGARTLCLSPFLWTIHRKSTRLLH